MASTALGTIETESSEDLSLRGLDDVVAHDLGECEHVIGELPGDLLGTLPQGVCIGQPVHREEDIGSVPPSIRVDGSREPGLLPKAPGLVHGRDRVLGTHRMDDERIEEVRLSVQDAGSDLEHELGQASDVLGKPFVEEQFVPCYTREKVVVDAAVHIMLGLLDLLLGDPGLADDRDRQTLPDLGESRVLGAQGVAGLGFGQHPPDHVQDRTGRIMGVPVRKLRIHEQGLGEHRDLVLDLRHGLRVIVATGLLMDLRRPPARRAPNTPPPGSIGRSPGKW